MNAVIIAGGTITDYKETKKYIPENAYIICADSGYDHAIKMGLKPDILIGDMDSIKSQRDVKEVVYPVRKDYTDSELVLEYATDNGYNNLLLLGFIGTRMDHTLTNISLLFKYKDINAVMVDGNNEIYVARTDNIIKGKKGDLISIIPLGGELTGVTTENLEYPLTEESLFFGEGRGVSNVMTDTECRITVKSGNGLIIKSRD